MGRKAINDDTRQQIIALHKAGLSTRKISSTLGSVSQNCVNLTIRNFQRNGFYQVATRSGRPKKQLAETKI